MNSDLTIFKENDENKLQTTSDDRHFYWILYNFVYIHCSYACRN